MALTCSPTPSSAWSAPSALVVLTFLFLPPPCAPETALPFSSKSPPPRPLKASVIEKKRSRLSNGDLGTGLKFPTDIYCKRTLLFTEHFNLGEV